MAQGIVNAPGNVYLKAKAYTDELRDLAECTFSAMGNGDYTCYEVGLLSYFKPTEAVGTLFLVKNVYLTNPADDTTGASFASWNYTDEWYYNFSATLEYGYIYPCRITTEAVAGVDGCDGEIEVLSSGVLSIADLQEAVDAAASAASTAQTKADEAYDLANTANTTLTQAYSELDAHTINDSPTDDTTSTATASHSGTVTMVDSVTRDSVGHVLSVNTKTVTLPSDNNTDTKVTQTLDTSLTSAYPVLLSSSSSTNTSTTYKTSKLTAVPSTGNITTSGSVTATGGFVGDLTGNADTATTLATARTIQTNLASTSSENFNGSANITPGVTGTLPIANGGTGNTTGQAASVANALTLTMNGSDTTYDGSETASKTWYAPTSVAGGTGYELVASGTSTTSVPAWKQPSGYVLCTTAASTATKVSSGNATNFKLVTGARVSVKFQYANTATTPTLNINSTGAKTIGIQTDYSTVTTGYANIGSWSAGEIVDFVYNGTYWVAVASSGGWIHATAAEVSSASTKADDAATAAALAATSVRYYATYVVAANDSVGADYNDYYCDGTDDDVQIQSAIDAANSAGGGKVLLMDGTYSVSTNINIKANVTVEGQGAGTIIDITADVSAFNVPSTASNWRLTGVHITTSYASPSSSMSGLYIPGATYGTIDNCLIEGVYYGIHTTSSANHINIINNHITGCVSHELYLYSTNYDIIKGNTLDSCAAYGIYLYSANYNTITGNVIDGGTYSIYFNSANSNTMSDNQLLNATTYGIRVYGTWNRITNNEIIPASGSTAAIYVYSTSSKYFTVSGNSLVCDNCSGYGINSAGGYGTISNNYIYDNNQAVHGISTSGTRNNIFGNSTYGCDNGIYVTGTYSLVTGNLSYNASTAGVSDSGSNNTVANNLTA